MINQMIEGIFEGARNDLFFKVDGNEFTLCVGIRFISGHGCSSGMDSIQMSISIIDCPCCSSVLSVQTDFFYRLNETLIRSSPAGCDRVERQVNLSSIYSLSTTYPNMDQDMAVLLIQP